MPQRLAQEPKPQESRGKLCHATAEHQKSTKKLCHSAWPRSPSPRKVKENYAMPQPSTRKNKKTMLQRSAQEPELQKSRGKLCHATAEHQKSRKKLCHSAWPGIPSPRKVEENYAMQQPSTGIVGSECEIDPACDPGHVRRCQGCIAEGAQGVVAQLATLARHRVVAGKISHAKIRIRGLCIDGGLAGSIWALQVGRREP